MKITLLEPSLTPSSKPFAHAQASTFLHGFYPRLPHTKNLKLKPSSNQPLMSPSQNLILLQQPRPSQHHPSTQSRKFRHHLLMPPLTQLPLMTKHHPPQKMCPLTPQLVTPIIISTKIRANHPPLHQQRTPWITFFYSFNAYYLPEDLKVKESQTVVSSTRHPT